jgi:hypothetical protein
MDIQDSTNIMKDEFMTIFLTIWAHNSPIAPHILFWNENLDKKSTAHLSELYF